VPLRFRAVLGGDSTIEAVRNSDDPEWSGSFFATDENVTAPIEDLSE